jgi:hypothetical protein
LFPQRFHEPIRSGAVTVAFRRWKRPTITEGGTLQTPAGLLAIDELTAISERDLIDRSAQEAGFPSRTHLLQSLPPSEQRTLYRIRFHRIGDDPRDALRADTDLDDDAVAAIESQLRRWDAASTDGPWTRALLELIASRPQAPSRSLAESTGTDQPRRKRRVRQLKGLGLTESLGTGYRLSDRGRAYLDRTRRSAR